MHPRMIGITTLFATTLLAGCASLGDKPAATAQLQARSGSAVSGTVAFYPSGAGLRVEARLSGLTPGEHGFHIHEVGDCSAPDGSSAKGHFNPAGKAHGHHDHAEHHAGDMPNLVANAQGEAQLQVTLAGRSLEGSDGILGRSVIVHADPDDYRSQPAGNSGKRIACGVIAR